MVKLTSEFLPNKDVLFARPLSKVLPDFLATLTQGD